MIKIKKSTRNISTPPLKESLLLSLPTFPLKIILDFLSPEEIFFALLYTCKTLYHSIKSNPFLKKICQRICLGIPPNLELPKNLDLEKILINFSNKNKLIEIPFYGYFTDGGMDQNNTDYWVNRIFSKGPWSICSKVGNNFHIIGTFIKGKDTTEINRIIYYEVFKLCEGLITKKGMIEKILPCLNKKPTDLEQLLNERIFKMMLEIQHEKIIEFLNSNKKKIEKNGLLKNYTIFQIMKAMENHILNIHTTVDRIEFISEYILKEKNLIYDEKKLAIIKKMNFSRTGYFTCPVKTIMVFVSNEIIDYENDQEFRIFDGCYDALSLKHKILNMNLKFPIKKTNIHQLEKFSDALEPLSNDFNYVLFKNNVNVGKLKPMIWLDVKSPTLNKIELIFPKKNCFSARSVLIKLIECEKIPPYNDDNIDINYISFGGEVVDL